MCGNVGAPAVWVLAGAGTVPQAVSTVNPIQISTSQYPVCIVIGVELVILVSSRRVNRLRCFVCLDQHHPGEDNQDAVS